MEKRQPVKALTIAGSDSGGAAGLQADLKTFTALGVYGMSAVTVVTAQNSVRVAALESMPATLVARQIEAVLEDYGADAIKTGFVGSVKLLEAIAAVLGAYQDNHPLPLVVDPVLVNHRGEAMFDQEVVEAYRRLLLPRCTIVTPNRREAALLCGQEVESWQDMTDAAQRLCEMGAGSALVTGGWHNEDYGDAFCDGRDVVFLELSHLKTSNTHGSGDTLSAAIAAFLAQEFPVLEAVRRAQTFTAAAIRGAVEWHMGGGHGPLNHMVRSEIGY